MKHNNILAVLLISGMYANAQQAFTNSGNLQIHTGASISGAGDFTNTSTATFVNNGTTYIKGSISNAQSSMAAGSGTLYLTGSSGQAINGTQALRTFNIVSNNAAGITLNNNLSVSGVHTFTAGMITTSATPNYIIYEAGSSYTGSGDTRHVNGWVKKSGNTAFTFPVGNGTVERPIAVTNLSATSVFNAKYAGVTTNTSNVTSPIVNVDPNEYWIVDQVSGGTAQMAMNWNNSKRSFPPYILSDIRVVSYTVASWTNRGGSASGDVTTTGAITSGVTSTFGAFTFGSITGVLPLQFLSMSAYRKQGTTLVQWKTVQEINTDYFEVERSENNTTAFRKIGVTDSKNSANINLYEYPDQLPLQGTAYYRIRSVDIDGKVKYSAIAVVSDNASRNGSIQLLNNPAYQSMQLAVSDAYKGAYDYELLSTSGQLVQKGKMQSSGNDVVTIPLSAAASPGTYILHIRNEKYQFTQQVMISARHY